MGFIYVCDKTSKSKVLITWVSKEDHGLQIGVHGLIVFLDAEKFENYFFAEVSQRITSINIRYFKDVRVPITSHTIFMHSVSSRKFSLQKLNSLSLFLTLNKICYSPVDILYVSVVCAVSPPSSVQSCNVCSLIFKSKRRQWRREAVTAAWRFIPPPWRLYFPLCPFVGWFVGWLICQQDDTKTAKWMSTKLGWRMCLGSE